MSFRFLEATSLAQTRGSEAARLVIEFGDVDALRSVPPPAALVQRDWKELVRSVQRKCNRRLLRWTSAEDLLIGASLRALQAGIASSRLSAALVQRFVRFEVLDRTRRMQAETAAFAPPIDLDRLPAFESPTPDEGVFPLLGLDAIATRILRLRHDRFTHAEIAAAIGVKPATVRQRVSRALRACARRLDPDQKVLNGSA